ncbi:unnamed protein product [Caretta caretta]
MGTGQIEVGRESPALILQCCFYRVKTLSAYYGSNLERIIKLMFTTQNGPVSPAFLKTCFQMSKMLSTC